MPLLRLPPWIARLPWAPYAIGLVGVLGLRGFARAAAGVGEPDAPPRPPALAPTIRLGSTGPAVAYWRWVVGVAPGSAFDQATHEATRMWQAARGLAADGVVGPATWAAAGVAGTQPPSPAPAPSPPPQPAPAPSPAAQPAPVPPPAPSPTAENVFGLSDDVGQREAQIMGYVAAGQAEHHWHPLTWTKNGRVVSILVSREPLALRSGPNRLIVSASYDAAQMIADMIGGALMTTRISDEIHRQAPVKLTPLSRNWYADGTMGKTSRMIEQSAALEALVAGRDGLKSNLGKDWVLTRRNFLPPLGTGVEKAHGVEGSRHNGANFGWYYPASASKSPGGEPVIQSVGLAHDRSHADYSQLLRYVKPDSLTIDGAPVGYATALADPTLSALIQDEGGTLPSDRHPDI